jgi:hypothetical protein
LRSPRTFTRMDSKKQEEEAKEHCLKAIGAAQQAIIGYAVEHRYVPVPRSLWDNLQCLLIGYAKLYGVGSLPGTLPRDRNAIINILRTLASLRVCIESCARAQQKISAVMWEELEEFEKLLADAQRAFPEYFWIGDSKLSSGIEGLTKDGCFKLYHDVSDEVHRLSTKSLNTGVNDEPSITDDEEDRLHVGRLLMDKFDKLLRNME